MPKVKTKKTIYVTWSEGFIWSAVCSALNYKYDFDDYEVVCIENSTIEFDLKKDDVVIHMGAYSSTTCEDPYIYVRLNQIYTYNLMDKCEKAGAKLIYASSASVYWNGNWPLNEYAWSKYYIDERNEELGTKFVWLRFFNVYWYGEYNKGKDASIISQWKNQYENTIKLFRVKAERDFVYIDDIVDVIMFFIDNYKPGIYDVWTWEAVSFENVAKEFIKVKGKGEIEYIKFPRHLKGKYQYHTQADLTALREAWYTKQFVTIYEGLRLYGC